MSRASDHPEDDAAAERSRTLAVLGVGYMGGSLALAARASGVATRVIGYEPDPTARAAATARGLVDVWGATPAEAVAGADLVVLAAPVRALVSLAAALAPALGPAALVLDLGSVKGDLGRRIDAQLGPARFVACHPLAGAEGVGPDAADAAIYAGRPCFVCPGANTPATTLARAESFWAAVGCRPVRLDPDVHDAFVAASSHLPHVAAYALAAALSGSVSAIEQHLPPGAAATSLRDTTRIAASSPAVWRDILLENRAQLMPLLDRLAAVVEELRTAVAAEDAATLEARLREGQRCRRRLFPA